MDGNTLAVKLNTGNQAIKEIGLYSYKNWTNGEAYSDVYLMDGKANSALDAPYNGNHKIAEDTYTYADGVLTAYTSGSVSKKTGATPTYYTVADGCKVFLVNPTTGECTDATLGSLATNVYGAKSDIWYQLDGYGYISLIYIVDDNPTVSKNQQISDSAITGWWNVTVNGGSSVAGVSSLIGVPTGKHVTVKVTKWEVFITDPRTSGWVEFKGTELSTVTGTQYRATIVVTADNGWEFNGSTQVGFASSGNAGIGYKTPANGDTSVTFTKTFTIS